MKINTCITKVNEVETTKVLCIPWGKRLSARACSPSLVLLATCWQKGLFSVLNTQSTILRPLKLFFDYVQFFECQVKLSFFLYINLFFLINKWLKTHFRCKMLRWVRKTGYRILIKSGDNLKMRSLLFHDLKNLTNLFNLIALTRLHFGMKSPLLKRRWASTSVF